MSLTASTRLGPYEILAPLGAGGMGEVYRARDTRLDRSVAIKVLPQHLSTNPEVRARFEREARTVSSLNHPHICTLYDVGREGDTDYLVMELIEGETLAARLARGPLPVDQTLKLGSEVADALDRAHRAGVVHRDLKPGNVMLTKSGAKLMDFGLARATGMAGPAGGSGVTMAALTQSPTVAAPLTAEGTIVGTFQYMAPEQLEGKDADARSDIWALGTVLYEMATGRKAFEGRSQASLIAAILEKDPPPLSELAPMAPRELDWIVRRCLAKDPDDRWQSVRDIMHELRRVMESVSPTSGITGPIPEMRTGAVVGARPRGGHVLAWAAAGLIVGALGAFLLSRMVLQPAHSTPLRLSIAIPGGMTFSSVGGDLAISPDGRLLAFVASDSAGTAQLWVRPLDSLTPRPLPGTQDAYMPFWAPDSRSLGFFAGNKLKKIGVSGGAPEDICAAASGRGGTWNKDDVILFAPGAEGPIYRISAQGGEAAPVTVVDTTKHENGHRFPRFLPDGKHFFFVTTPGREGGHESYIARLGSKERSFVVRSDGVPAFASPRWLLFRKNRLLLAQRFDPGNARLSGKPQAVGETGIGAGIQAPPTAWVSDNGILACLPAIPSRLRFTWVDRSGREEVIPSLPAGSFYSPELSPDGTRLVVARGQNDESLTSGSDLWMIELSRSLATRFTYDPGYNQSPIWSPDGNTILYSSSKTGAYGLYLKPATGAGEPRFVARSSGLVMSADDWSRDGRFAVYDVADPKTGTDLWLISMVDEPRATPLLKTPFQEINARISPDARWFAYQSDETGRLEVYVQSFPVPGSKFQVSSGGGAFPQWRSDGRELFYRAPDGTMMAVAVESGAMFRAGTPQALFKPPRPDAGTSVAPGGKRFLFAMVPEESVRQGPIVIVNWTALLEGR